MIVSASRRTDLPACYPMWFANRLRAGFCRVANPFNPHQIATVDLTPAAVDVFVFWTRDPRPFMPVLDELDALGHRYVFLITLTGYGPPLEPEAPAAADAVRAFRALADRLGPARVTWRYDPVILGPGLEPVDHGRRFAALAERLEGAADTVIFSFLDLYRKTTRRLTALARGAAYLRDPVHDPGLDRLVAEMAAIAARRGMTLASCAEDDRFAGLGVHPGRCIDGSRLGRLFGFAADERRDRGQRTACRCSPSRDIGAPDTCVHGCVYCYATRSDAAARRHHARHDPTAELLSPAIMERS